MHMRSDGQLSSDSPIPGDILAGGPVAPEDVSITIKDGHGAYVTTDDGEEFLDYKLGSGPMLVGHAHPHVVEALRERIEQGTTFYAPTQLAYDFAERLVEAIPCAESLKFVSTGTEATYLAMRLAHAYTGKRKVLTFEGAYHGWHDQVLVSSQRAGTRVLETESTTVDTAGAMPGMADEVVVAPFNDIERTADLIESHADELSCVIAEPMMRAIPPTDSFLDDLRAICDEQDVLLVFDEVVTGFRLAWGGGQEHYGVEPDLATYGKVIGGGTPVGAVCGPDDILEALHPSMPPEDGGVEIGGTLNGNPLGMAAGMATLDVLAADGTYRGLHEYGQQLQSLFEDVLADAAIPGVAVGDGPVVDYVVTDASEVTDWPTYLRSDSETKAAIDEALFEQGILKSIGGKMYLSTVHGDEEFEQTAEAFKEAVARVVD